MAGPSMVQISGDMRSEEYPPAFLLKPASFSDDPSSMEDAALAQRDTLGNFFHGELGEHHQMNHSKKETPFTPQGSRI